MGPDMSLVPGSNHKNVQAQDQCLRLGPSLPDVYQHINLVATELGLWLLPIVIFEVGVMYPSHVHRKNQQVAWEKITYMTHQKSLSVWAPLNP